MKTYYLQIAGFLLDVSMDESLLALPKNYHPFIVEDGVGEMLCSVVVSSQRLEPEPLHEVGIFDDLGYKQEVYSRDGGGYWFRIYDYEGVIAAEMQSDALFCHNRLWLNDASLATKEFGFNNGMMISFAFSSAYHRTLTMHSSTVAKDGVAYMFLGKSGTGKSTHSSLWLKYISGYHLLNDDNPVVRFVDDELMVYGTPWSGKTPCYRQEKARVGALVMLEQKPYNNIRRENVAEAMASMLCSCSIMIWDKQTYSVLLQTITDVIEKRGVYHLECLPDEAAAQLSHSVITKD